MNLRRLFLILLALGVIGVGIFFGFRVKKQETVYGSLSAESVEKVNAILERDADGDGLKDWEEELWETNRDNPDTDGDGTADGVEVSSGRNPLKPGPDDALDEKTVEEKTTLAAQGEPTLTDTIARDLFAEYLKLKQGGRKLTAEDERQLLLRFFNNPPPLEAVRLYTRADITVTEEGDRGAIRDYANDVAAVFKKYPNEGESELDTLTAAVEREDEKVLEGLKPRIALYESILRELLPVAVPVPMAQNHLDVLNALSALVQSVSGMQYVISDPARALGSVGSYPHATELLVNSFAETRRLLIQNKVTFGSDEPGGVFME